MKTWIKMRSSVADDRIIAIGLLTARDVETLGTGFRRLFPIDEAPCFSDLLRAIDDADRELRQEMPMTPRQE